MKHRAFTLVELLFVIAIIAVLATILIPALIHAKHLARKAICQANLHHVGVAFGLHREEEESGEDMPYPDPDVWPGVPMGAAEVPGIFICPVESDKATGDMGSLQFHPGWFPDLWITFAEGEFCRVSRGSGYTQYRLEDLPHGDFDFNDAVFRVYDGPPMRGQVHAAETAQNNQLWISGRLKFADCRNHVGEMFDIPGGSNYGYNAQVHLEEVAPDTVVVLDYPRLLANNGEDIGTHVRDSARHLDQLNVLSADQSVLTMGVNDLDPHFSSASAERWTP